MQPKEKIELLNSDQRAAFELVKAGKNVNISGPGGVGKSFLIDILKDYFGGSAVFCAPTGIAALNIGGATLHSTFGLRMGICFKRNWDNVPKRVMDLFADGSVKAVIIDEISMVRADIFETIDQFLRRALRKNKPFGGLQIITVGDFFQLPPVLKYNSEEGRLFKEEYDSIYSFTTDSWKQAGFVSAVLNKVVRQDDEVMINHLQNIRTKSDGYIDSINYFNTNCGGDVVDDDSDDTVLCTTNASANQVNQNNYNSIEGPENVYHARITGNFKERPSPDYLPLKVGTKVLITANTDSHINGEVGYVSALGNGYVDVMRGPDDTVTILPYEWKEFRYVKTADGRLTLEQIGSYRQLPLKHGWGITIHKAQGMTLERAAVYMGRGAFAHGQTYVALSRVKSVEGLSLISDIRARDIIVDQDVRDFYNGKFSTLLG